MKLLWLQDQYDRYFLMVRGDGQWGFHSFFVYIQLAVVLFAIGVRQFVIGICNQVPQTAMPRVKVLYLVFNTECSIPDDKYSIQNIPWPHTLHKPNFSRPT